MKKPPIDLDSQPLDDYERETMAALDKALDEGTIVSHLTPERKAELEQAARNTLNPPKTRITTHLQTRDLSRLKAEALKMGMPYQTLLASVVHRYVEGTLVEKDPSR